MNSFFNELEAVIAKRQQELKSDSYTCRLLSVEGLILRKVSEEMFEVLEAAFKGDKPALVYEACDLFYHMLVLLRKYGISLSEIESELRRRNRENN